MTNEKLIDEVRTLELEVQKLELENRIACMKAEQPIDECCVGCTGLCKVVDVAAKLQRELDECVEMNLGLVERDQQVTIEIMRLRDHIKMLKDRNAEDLYELYGVYEAELVSMKSVYEIMRTNHHNSVAKLREDIRGLEVELTEKQEIIDKITRLRADEVETLYRHKDELSARKHDSEVIEKVVEVLKQWNACHLTRLSALNQISNIVSLDVSKEPEGTTIDEVRTLE